MQLVWKKHAIDIFNPCQFIKATSFLQPNPDAPRMVNLNLYETKLPYCDEENFPDALYQWLHKIQLILSAFGRMRSFICVSWDWVGNIAMVIERKTTAQ